MASSIQRFILARMGWLGGLSHVRAVMFCLYRYLATKGGGYRSDNL